MYDGLIFI